MLPRHFIPQITLAKGLSYLGRGLVQDATKVGRPYIPNRHLKKISKRFIKNSISEGISNWVAETIENNKIENNNRKIIIENPEPIKQVLKLKLCGR